MQKQGFSVSFPLQSVRISLKAFKIKAFWEYSLSGNAVLYLYIERRPTMLAHRVGRVNGLFAQGHSIDYLYIFVS